VKRREELGAREEGGGQYGGLALRAPSSRDSSHNSQEANVLQMVPSSSRSAFVRLLSTVSLDRPVLFHSSATNRAP
jgi:hypothetical protein